VVVVHHIQEREIRTAVVVETGHIGLLVHHMAEAVLPIVAEDMLAVHIDLAAGEGIGLDMVGIEVEVVGDYWSAHLISPYLY